MGIRGKFRHSARSATIGSTFAARRAGNSADTIPVASSKAAAAISESASHGASS